MDIFLDIQKCPILGGGSKMDIFGSWIFLFVNEIFSTVLSLKHHLADAQNPTFTNYLFWTEYFRRVYPWNINGQAIGFETFEINQFWTEYFRLKRDNSERVRFYERGEFRRSPYAWYPTGLPIRTLSTRTIIPAFSSHGISSQFWNRYIQTIQPSKNLRTLLSQDPPKKHPPFSRIF